MPASRPLRIAAFGFLGLGNLGNEGSFAALLEHLRSLEVDVEVRCFGGDPVAVAQEHGVTASPLMSHRGRPASSGPVERMRKAMGRLVDVPRMWRLVGQVDVVVVPGMGVLEPEVQERAVWGLPYWMLLASSFARLRRRSFVLLSVGAGVPRNGWVRRYFRWTLRMARYTSFRDRGSQSAALKIGGRPRPGTVTADLVFGMSVPDHLPTPVPNRIVLGVMTPHGQEPDGAAVTGYVEKVTQTLERLLDAGHSVRVVVGDLADGPLADRVVRSVRHVRAEIDATALAASRAATLPALMAEMAQAEVVVASRYHNLICALMARRPAVSLAYAPKNAELLDDFGMAGYDQSMTDFDVDVLVQQVKELFARRTELEPLITRELEQRRAVLCDQYREFDEQVLGVGIR